MKMNLLKEIDRLSDDNNDSTSDEDLDSDEDEVMKIDEYRQKILANPADYDCHVKLINALRISADIEGCRTAREAMSKEYPLTPEMWLSWIDDEKKNAVSKEVLTNLFDRALKDYKNVDIWFDYCQHMSGIVKDFDQIRNVFEKAIADVGYHYEKGYLIWEMYIVYEKGVVLENIDLNSPEGTEQVKRVYDIFLRQLSMPISNNCKSYEDFQQFVEDYKLSLSANVKVDFDNSQKLSKQLEPFENRLLKSTVDYDGTRLDGNESHSGETKEQIWLDYLSFVEKQSSKSHLFQLFERCLTDICLSRQIWERYLRFVERFWEKDCQQILTTYQRALRNYKCSLALWIGLVQIMERCNCPIVEIRATFNLIFEAQLLDSNPTLTIWLAYMDFEKRLLDRTPPSEAADLSHIRQLLNHLTTVANYLDYDPQCLLVKYWAFIEAKFGKNIDKSRELWSLIMKSLGTHYSSLWLENIEFERKFGDFEHLKRIASSAVNSKLDYTEYLFERVLRCIAEDGDLESYLHFVKKIANKQQTKSDSKSTTSEAKARSSVKRKSSDSSSEIVTGTDKKPLKKMKSEVKPNEKARVESVRPIQQIKPSQSNSTKSSEWCNERSVFVSNLNFKVTEADLQQKFANCGLLTEVRLVRDNVGKSKGYAYVQFENATDVEAALLLERNDLQGRPMFVNRCNPDKRHKFQFAVGQIERSKLFVKNLPRTITQYALEEIFGKYCGMKEVRLVTFKSGVSKGIAYVEFVDEESASKALVGTDGIDIGGSVIEVKLSEPPLKGGLKPDEDEEDPDKKSDIMFKIPTANIIPRPMLTPRKIIHSRSSTADATNVNNASKKSNDYFRQFLK